MNRIAAIATINARLADADDDTVKSVADFVEAVTAGPRLRELSARERQLLEQAKEDFKEGRTLTMDDFMARTDAVLARHRAATRAK